MAKEFACMRHYTLDYTFQFQCVIFGHHTLCYLTFNMLIIN